ncbi:hypothetical protein FHS40_001444 [Streptomyces spectabilis]|uniref:Uncharacterized protein n=1 Tax=Streptomyces spectabilis TaxID=68270 RepID=A0A7W8APV7_STRST|nr:hypothetical protein [Streptomyces spectabilis]
MITVSTTDVTTSTTKSCQKSGVKDVPMTCLSVRRESRLLFRFHRIP